MKTRALPVFPLSPDPIRPGVGRDAVAARLTIDPVGPEDSPQIGLVTLGCDKNTVDSEKMLAALVGHGARVSSDVEGSDVVVVNTCGFIEAGQGAVHRDDTRGLPTQGGGQGAGRRRRRLHGAARY